MNRCRPVKKDTKEDPPPVWTRNFRVLGSSEPTPEKPLRSGGAQGGSQSNPPSWIPNRGVQDEPCTGLHQGRQEIGG